MVRRRNLLLMGVAAGALGLVGGGGAALVAMDRYQGWIRDILQRSLPGYDLEPDGLALFTDEYFAKKKSATKLRLFAAAQPVVNAKPVLPEDMAEDVEEEERRILSNFLIGSDFFENYPRGRREITYRGSAEACSSPFATF
jgi:hypothetical protein